MIPTLTTPRLRLRAHTPDDFAAVAAMWADPDVARHIGGTPFTAEESWRRLLAYEGHWRWLGYGYFAVVDRADGGFLGSAGFADYRRAMVPALDAPEAGWAFTRAAWGRGIATEALAALVAWADARGIVKTVSIIDPANAASIRVACKTGYVQTHEATYRGAPTGVFTRHHYNVGSSA